MGTDDREAAVARLVARAVRARPRQRLARRAVAAGVSEDAGRATPSRAEPRQESDEEAGEGSTQSPQVTR